MSESARGTLLLALVSGQPGGGQRVALSVARAVVDRGWNVTAVAPDEGPILQEFRSLGARTFVVGALRSHDLSKMARLARIIRETKASCIYTHSVPVHETAFAFAVRMAGARLVVHRHSLGHLSRRWLLCAYQQIMWRLALQWADQVVCVSEQVRAQVIAMGRDAVVIPNGVPIPDGPAPSRTDGPPLIGFVGRLDRNKRVEDFITAASLVRRHFPNAVFVVAGGGIDESYAAYCRDLAARLELERQLTFVRPVPDAQRMLAALDILVLPSVLEGHSLVLLEAMALGKPVIATDISGCRETIRHGVDGLLVPPRNPGAIAAAVIGLLESPAQRAGIGVNAHARVRSEFSEARMLSQLLPLVTSA